jgi:hypothetical protein
LASEVSDEFQVPEVLGEGGDIAAGKKEEGCDCS